MILIGLQNTEKKYEKTRHNVGAIVLKYLVEQEGGEFVFDKYTNSFFAHTQFIKIYVPNTFMNLSGESVQKVLKQENISVKEDLKENIFVFFDDVTIPVGSYKISVGEGASSHNGIKSIIANLGGNNSFTRVRIGVGPIKNEQQDLADFVLGNMNDSEIIHIQNLVSGIFLDLNLK